MPFDNLSLAEIELWLCEEDPAKLEELWAAADAARREHVGEAVHLRGLVEISNHCCRMCGYCGLRAANRGLERYRMTRDDILGCAREARDFGYGTVVMQAGEDYGITRDWLADVIRAVKDETGQAVTLSLGERPDADLIAWREAGADRYLLRFETSDPRLYAMIHPPGPGCSLSDRIAMLHRLRGLGYEIGSGVMVGIPGQTWAMLARDLDTFRGMDMDMIGIGPYLSHPATPLARNLPVEGAAAALPMPAPGGEQVPNSEAVTYRAVALTRLLCPESNIPSTTALFSLNLERGRELGLQRGANVVMPNLTPLKYRHLYEIYPAKACLTDTGRESHERLAARLAAIGRAPGLGHGGRGHAKD